MRSKLYLTIVPFAWFHGGGKTKHMDMCACICAYLHTCTSTCLCVCLLVCVCVRVCSWTYAYVCVYGCLSVCCMHVTLDVYACAQYCLHLSLSLCMSVSTGRCAPPGGGQGCSIGFVCWGSGYQFLCCSWLLGLRGFNWKVGQTDPKSEDGCVDKIQPDSTSQCLDLAGNRCHRRCLMRRSRT